MVQVVAGRDQRQTLADPSAIGHRCGHLGDHALGLADVGGMVGGRRVDLGIEMRQHAHRAPQRVHGMDVRRDLPGAAQPAARGWNATVAAGRRTRVTDRGRADRHGAAGTPSARTTHGPPGPQSGIRGTRDLQRHLSPRCWQSPSRWQSRLPARDDNRSTTHRSWTSSAEYGSRGQSGPPLLPEENLPRQGRAQRLGTRSLPDRGTRSRSVWSAVASR